MKEMTSYAASLTGATGKALDAETITVGPKQLIKIPETKPAKHQAPPKKENTKKDAAPSSKAAAAKKGTKKGAAGLSKADLIKAENAERKGGNEADKAFNAWATVRKDLDVVSNDQDRYLRTVEYLKGLDSVKTTHLQGEINLYALQALLSWWADSVKSDKKSESYHIVALIWTIVRTLGSITSPFSKEIDQHATKICSILGITNAVTALESAILDRKLSFVFKYPANTASLRIDMTQYDFQLNHCGPYMDRMLDAKPDARVSSFVPDGWQRDVLDQLDSNKSVFVVAPTSAGKTFISFYAMEQVLREGNDGVLVYVAPTKALVNQIAAEVQGKYPSSLW